MPLGAFLRRILFYAPGTAEPSGYSPAELVVYRFELVMVNTGVEIFMDFAMIREDGFLTMLTFFTDDSSLPTGISLGVCSAHNAEPFPSRTIAISADNREVSLVIALNPI